MVDKFHDWMKNNDKKQCAVAAKIGISASYLSDILKLGKMPSIRIAYEIEKYTNGVVTVYDWLDQDMNDRIKSKKKKNKDKKDLSK